MYTLGKPTTGKNLARSEEYALLFSSPIICNANTKKVVLTMELPLTLWPAWLLQDLLLPLLFFKIHSFTVVELWNNIITPSEWNPLSF